MIKRPVIGLVLLIALAAACVFVPRMFNLSPLEPASTPTPTPTATPTDTPVPLSAPAEMNAATQTALTGSPVQGAVIINEGRPMGATAGSHMEIPAAFSASSAAGEVREMRTRAAMYCVQPDEIAVEPWQPFAPGKTFPFTPPINWVGFYVTVQYRDSAGNLSPLYCDDISVEGMPAVTP